MNCACRSSCGSSQGCGHFSCFNCLVSCTYIYLYIYIHEVKVLTHHDITKIKNIILSVLHGVLVDIEFDVDVAVVVGVVVEAIIKILHLHRTI